VSGCLAGRKKERKQGAGWAPGVEASGREEQGECSGEMDRDWGKRRRMSTGISLSAPRAW